MDLTYEIDLVYEIFMIIGVFVLGISGSLSAMEKKFDIVGVLVIAVATSFGGGTIRDMLINRDVFWIAEPYYIYIIVASSVFTIMFKKYLNYLRKTLLFFDTVGLALFTILGVEIGYASGLHPAVGIALGTITGVFGGVMRDVLVNDVPIIFRKEIYASISAIGAGIYVLLQQAPISGATDKMIALSFIILARLLVVYFEISLPNMYKNEKNT